jgi:hypothetical protein
MEFEEAEINKKIAEGKDKLLQQKETLTKMLEGLGKLQTHLKQVIPKFEMEENSIELKLKFATEKDKEMFKKLIGK